MVKSLSVDRGVGKKPLPAVHGTEGVKICRGPGCKNELTGKQTKFCCDPCRNRLHSGERLEGRKALSGKGKMRAAKLANSSRLRKIHGLLVGGEWHTRLEIFKKTGVDNVSTAISELRKNGFEIEKRHVAGGLWEYRLDVKAAFKA